MGAHTHTARRNVECFGSGWGRTHCPRPTLGCSPRRPDVPPPRQHSARPQRVAWRSGQSDRHALCGYGDGYNRDDGCVGCAPAGICSPRASPCSSWSQGNRSDGNLPRWSPESISTPTAPGRRSSPTTARLWSDNTQTSLGFRPCSLWWPRREDYLKINTWTINTNTQIQSNLSFMHSLKMCRQLYITRWSFYWTNSINLANLIFELTC